MSCNEEEIELFCKDLPRYKRPRKIIFANVPRNPTGKIEKPKLREIYAGGSIVRKPGREGSAGRSPQTGRRLKQTKNPTSGYSEAGLFFYF